jgi:hypothetical protein
LQHQKSLAEDENKKQVCGFLEQHQVQLQDLENPLKQESKKLKKHLQKKLHKKRKSN